MFSFVVKKPSTFTYAVSSNVLSLAVVAIECTVHNPASIATSILNKSTLEAMLNILSNLSGILPMFLSVAVLFLF